MTDFYSQNRRVCSTRSHGSLLCAFCLSFHFNESASFASFLAIDQASYLRASTHAASRCPSACAARGRQRIIRSMAAVLRERDSRCPVRATRDVFVADRCMAHAR